MTYRRIIGQPTWYTDRLGWAASRGAPLATMVIEKAASSVIVSGNLLDLVDQNPYTELVVNIDDGIAYIQLDFGSAEPGQMNSLVLFNVTADDLAESNFRISHKSTAYVNDTASQGTEVTNIVPVINWASDHVLEEGDAIITFDPAEDRYWMLEITQEDVTGHDVGIGAVFLGNKFSLSRSADNKIFQLNGRSGEGFSETYGGNRLGHQKWSSLAADGVSYSPFAWTATALHKPGGRSGHRLAWSEVDTEEVFPSDFADQRNSDNIYTALVEACAGSLLRSVFVPDGSSTTIGDYYLARMTKPPEEYERVTDKAHNFGLTMEQDA